MTARAPLAPSKLRLGERADAVRTDRGAAGCGAGDDRKDRPGDAGPLIRPLTARPKGTVRHASPHTHRHVRHRGAVVLLLVLRRQHVIPLAASLRVISEHR